ncbi:hypothetical protein Dda_9220 [Drechslerella dactyloides]|uniref:Apple domain-containing protein n=1 Tax=Drechslerella dactyloides TaxID=74499 RepID=A0AAD6IQZ6_DREDA|nr:hypothetical protein Dda_9220 [Drechslerella dactyloides]
MCGPSLLVPVAGLVGAATAISCHADNCLRAVRATARLPQASMDCSSYLRSTFTPATKTYTDYSTISELAQESQFATRTDTVFEILTSVIKETATIEVPGSTKTKTSYNPALKKRQAASTIPAYASPCRSADRYISACSCIAVTGSIVVTAPTPSTTLTIPTTVTYSTQIETITVEILSTTVTDATVTVTTTNSTAKIVGPSAAVTVGAPYPDLCKNIVLYNGLRPASFGNYDPTEVGNLPTPECCLRCYLTSDCVAYVRWSNNLLSVEREPGTESPSISNVPSNERARIQSSNFSEILVPSVRRRIKNMAPRTRSAGSSTRSKPKPDYTAHIRKRKTTAGSGDGVSKPKPKSKPGPKPKPSKVPAGQPKRRGRPPKNPNVNSTPGAVLKKRGRPANAVAATGGKPRGRPRKHALPSGESQIIGKALRAAKDGESSKNKTRAEPAKTPGRRGRRPTSESVQETPAESSKTRNRRQIESAEDKPAPADKVPEKTPRKRQSQSLVKDTKEESRSLAGSQRVERKTPRTRVTPKTTPQSSKKPKSTAIAPSQASSRKRSQIAVKTPQDEDSKPSEAAPTPKSKPTKSPVSRTKTASSTGNSSGKSPKATAGASTPPGKRKAAESLRSEQKSGAQVASESPPTSITSRPPPPPTPPPKARTPKQTPKSLPKHPHTVQPTTSPKQNAEVVGKRARSEEHDIITKDTVFPTNKRARTEERQLERNANELRLASGQETGSTNHET